jgi:hypothetical protein
MINNYKECLLLLKYKNLFQSIKECILFEYNNVNFELPK